MERIEGGVDTGIGHMRDMGAKYSYNFNATR
jgi:hypothetical protein